MKLLFHLKERSETLGGSFKKKAASLIIKVDIFFAEFKKSCEYCKSVWQANPPKTLKEGTLEAFFDTMPEASCPVYFTDQFKKRKIIDLWII